MAKVSPPKDRSTVADTAEGVLVSTPARKHWFIIMFLPLWLIGWAMGAFSAGSAIVGAKSAQGESLLFLIAWLTIWVVFGIAAIVVFLWTLFGVENVTFGPSAITIRRQVLGLGPMREYDCSHASRLRVAPDSFNFFDPRMALRFWGFGGGPIAFDYGSSTVRIGGGLDESEANRIVARVTNRFPSIGRNDA